MKSIKSICASICLILPLAVLGSQLTNGSFEMHTFKTLNVEGVNYFNLSRGDTHLLGWTIGSSAITLNFGNQGVFDFPPADGDLHLVFHGSNTPYPGAYISQTFDTVPKRDYTVTFSLGGVNIGPQRLEATVTSDTGVKLATVLARPPTHGYAQQRFPFTASSAKTTILFSSDGEVAFDAVDVSEVPPTIIARLPSGLGSPVAAAPKGVVGWWPGDDSAKDISGTNHGTVVNVAFAPSLVGQAFSFKDDNSHVKVPVNRELNSITNEITLEAWVWHEGTGNSVQRYLTLTPDRAQISYDVGRFVFELHFPDGTLSPLRYPTNILGRKWYHVTGTFDGKEQKLFIDGNQVGSISVNHQFRSSVSSEFLISFPGAAMNGLIDEAVIYNRALTAAEIQSHFAAINLGMAKTPIISDIRLSFPGNARLNIKGQAGKSVIIQHSENLLDWVTLTTDPNLTGTINVTDSSAGAFNRRFYRAVSK